MLSGILNNKEKIISMSHPCGSYNNNTFDILKKLGIEIGFNARYLLDITSLVDGEGCRITLADSASPTIIQDAGDSSSLFVIMPLRV